MKNSGVKFVALGLVMGGIAHAGFRDPIQNTTERAADLTVVAPSAARGAVAKPTASAPAALPSQVKNAPAATNPRQPASTVQSVYGPQAPKNQAPSLRDRPSPIAQPAQGPVQRAPSLPGRLSLEIPGVQLPSGGNVSVKKDSAPVVMAPRNRADLHNFSRKARMQILPTRAYPELPRSVEIASRFAEALKPYPHKPIRTPLNLTISKIAKISNPPSPIQYENMVKRLDALFEGIYQRYPAGIVALFELSRSRTNAKELQARDALFAGILSERAGWETVAGNLLEESALKRLDANERYLGILWKELDSFESISHVDRVIASVNPLRAKIAAPAGDKANYAMARRVLGGKVNPAVTADIFEQRIGQAALKERLEMMRAVSHLRLKNGKRAEAVATLQKIESEGSAELREEARLALARALLQDGKTAESLDLYRRVAKTGANRLEVLGEQAYAEYRSGLFQESLGKAVGLQSPYFQYGFAPDIHMVEIVSRKAMCDFGGAEAGIRRFEERYTRELAAIQSVLGKKTNTQAFYEELISYHGKVEPMRFQRFLLRLASVMENQKVLNDARSELDKVGELGLRRHTVERPKGWDEFVVAMNSSWSGKARSMKEESAKAALAEADYMVQRLRGTFAQLELLSLDVATGASKNFNLQSAMNFPVRKLASAEIDQEKLHWPFEDEIWEDELDFLKMKNPSKCANVASQQAVQ
jgi:tetratricopeptide (TPR) repeat protein